MNSSNRVSKKPRGGISWGGIALIVLVVGVLVAIALPNHRHTASYARNSRLQADFRVLTTALEAYAAKEHAVPPALGALTTPVAYIAAIPADDAWGPGPNGGIEPFVYVPLRPAGRVGPGQAGTGWVLLSAGPDRAHEIVPERDLAFDTVPTAAEIQKRLSPLTYDATNGTKSRGDVFRIGGLEKK
jgi:hypothetical protein